MKSADFLEALAGSGIAVFTINDAVKIIGKKSNYVSLFLSKNKKFGRIEKGKYYVKGSSIYEIASNAVQPSYLSMASAYRYYNLITQMPNVIYVMSATQHRSIDIEGFRIEFIKLKKSRLFGYKRVDGAFVADLEKAIIDSLYMIDYEYVEEAFRNALDSGLIRTDVMVDYALLMKSKALVNRTGFLLDRFGVYSDRLYRNRSQLYVKLSSEGGKKDKKWRVAHD